MKKLAPYLFLRVFSLAEDEISDDKYKFSLDVWKRSHRHVAYEAGGERGFRLSRNAIHRNNGESLQIKMLERAEG